MLNPARFLVSNIFDYKLYQQLPLDLVRLRHKIAIGNDV